MNVFDKNCYFVALVFFNGIPVLHLCIKFVQPYEVVKTKIGILLRIYSKMTKMINSHFRSKMIASE